VPPSLGSSSLSKSFLCSRPPPSTKSPGPPSTFPPTSPSHLARRRPRRHLPRPVANFSSRLCPHLPARRRLGSGHCPALIWFASSCYLPLHTFQLRQHCPHSLPASAVIASCLLTMLTPPPHFLSALLSRLCILGPVAMPLPYHESQVLTCIYTLPPALMECIIVCVLPPILPLCPTHFSV